MQELFWIDRKVEESGGNQSLLEDRYKPNPVKQVEILSLMERKSLVYLYTGDFYFSGISLFGLLKFSVFSRSCVKILFKYSIEKGYVLISNFIGNSTNWYISSL